MDTPSEEKLRQMPYSELKKHAKRKGIKANIKAEELISLILENECSAEDSFVAMEQKIINSCKKNKIKKFEEDKQTESDTPRRETYTLECPSSDTIVNLDNDLIVSSASPLLKKTPATNDTSRNVTMSRGSERKSKKRKVSFVTPLRRSTRLSIMTPQYASVKDRPKTPIPSRKSTGRKSSSSIRGKISFAETPSETDCGNNTSTKFSGKKEKRISTPMPVSKTKRMNLSSTGLEAPIATPEVSFVDEHPKESNASNFTAIKENAAMDPLPNTKGKISFTPKSDVKKAATSPMSGKSKRLAPKSGGKIVASPYRTPGSKVKATPNFKKIHQKAFEKMESIDEYQQRKATNSARKIKEALQHHDSAKSNSSKKVAAKKTVVSKPFGGIPFIPSKTNSSSFQVQQVSGKKPAITKHVSLSESTLTKKLTNQDTKKSVKHVSRENTPLKRRFKFDLKASLSKKLPYKPHSGPLKPLTENMNNTTLVCPPPQKAPGNKFVEAKRVESRGILRGVRKNRRFELQMSNRKLGQC
ncbi:uncharacterized protein TNIN_374741 [Trichonephila inaurata madagascariensis]|uniref:Nucleolar and spindle-associated protein 1 n=1 Tax=Trichonephila inaurata madagascariensis TaxID=2747483 RepID=A0A8X6YRA6_9ARAC|nr:uncharacterized protein TNIN_374741 [Trichonephila inaurata madagascariensis]